MRIRIGHRLFIGFLLSAVIVLALMTALTRWYFHNGFIEYVNESEVDRLLFVAGTLERFYAEHGSWDVLHQDEARWRDLTAPPPLEGIKSRASDYEPAAYDDPLAISPRVILLDSKGERLFGPPVINETNQIVPIRFGGKIVGTLQVNPLSTLVREVDKSFAQEQNDWYVGSALSAILLAGALAFIFSGPILRRISDLTGGTRALIGGDYGARISVNSQDELGDLGNDFNTLARTLERHEALQRDWIANISHELRTPLTILRGLLHGIDDGVREFNETTQKSLVGEVDRLTKLVDDIYDLSISDIGALQYRREIGNVIEVLAETTEVFQDRIADADLVLTTVFPPEPVYALIDPIRLRQLFTNVLENSIRYTHAGGEIKVACRIIGSEVTIDFDDSAPSVPEAHLPRLFERLYRIDSSRRRSTGGAGLGLAICQNIAHALDGQIIASPSSLGGISIRLLLPLKSRMGG
jgi:two-component system sensor histidine kinase BaeS